MRISRKDKMMRKTDRLLRRKYRDIPHSGVVNDPTNKAKVYVVSSSFLLVTDLLHFTLFHVMKYFRL